MGTAPAEARGRTGVVRLRGRPAHGPGLLLDEHFTVDGTLIEAAASHKSFKRTLGQVGEPLAHAARDTTHPNST